MSDSTKTCMPDKLVDLTIDSYALVFAKFKPEDLSKHIFLDKDEVMNLLKCSATTLQNYRDQHKFEFYQLSSKSIIYHKNAFLEFIESKKVTRWK